MPIKNSRMLLREGLMRLLDGLSEKRNIYVCAPAGYGKTVAVHQWLEQSGHRGAVIALDEYDNDPARFCSRFCSALRRCQPENAALLEITSHPAFESASGEFAFRAIDTLSDGESVKLFIDDLHLIHDERVLRLLMSFLERLPKSFGTVLASRNEPPSGFSEMWTDSNGIARVTADDLRFSREEIMLLCEKRAVPISSGQAGDIYRFTGGWAIGIGAVLLSGGELRGESLGFLEEYIEANVWQRWDLEICEFMLQTAVVHELAPSLCAALTGRQDSESLLSELTRQSAFVLQTEQGTYRYHRLFHDFLRHILERRGEEFSRTLLNKAGSWYLTEGDFYSAVEYFIECENHEGIAECFMLLVNSGHRNYILEKLIPIVNSSVINAAAEKSPYIYSLLSWASFIQGRTDDLFYYSDRYYELSPELVRADPRLTLNVMYVKMTDLRITMHDLMEPLTAMPGIIAEQPAASDIQPGVISQNMPLMHRGTRDLSEYSWEIGELDEVKRAHVWDVIFGELTSLVLECAAAGLLYERGELFEALDRALAAVAEIKPHFSPESKFFAGSILVYILDALGQTGQANEALKRIGDMIELEKAYYLNYNYSALKVRRKLASGDGRAADGWLAEHGISLHDGLDFYKLYGHMTTCRAYIAKREYGAAIILLTKVLTLVTAYGRPLDIMETQTLLSIAYWKKGPGFQGEAIRYLEQAVEAAYEYGYMQLFVTDGAELSDMLFRLEEQAERQSGAAPAYAGFISTLRQKAQEGQKDGLTGCPTVSKNYTNKQLSVMRLLWEGRSHREIAEAMGIKHSTLRSHITAIYKKLNVANETEAVVKIKALGILEDNTNHL